MKILKRFKGFSFSIPLLLIPSAAIAGLSSGYASGGEGSLGLFGLVFFGILAGTLTLGQSAP